MSTWTEDTHVRARRAVEEGDIDGENGWAVAYLADALDEIERLRAESARRMVWLETEQRAHAQTHAALVDMTERAAHPEITYDMVRAAAREFWLSGAKDRAWAEAAWDDMGGGEPCAERALVEIAAERALEAALNPKENEA